MVALLHGYSVMAGWTNSVNTLEAMNGRQVVHSNYFCLTFLLDFFLVMLFHVHQSIWHPTSPGVKLNLERRFTE